MEKIYRLLLVIMAIGWNHAFAEVIKLESFPEGVDILGNLSGEEIPIDEFHSKFMQIENIDVLLSKDSIRCYLLAELTQGNSLCRFVLFERMERHSIFKKIFLFYESPDSEYPRLITLYSQQTEIDGDSLRPKVWTVYRYYRDANTLCISHVLNPGDGNVIHISLYKFEYDDIIKIFSGSSVFLFDCLPTVPDYYRLPENE